MNTPTKKLSLQYPIKSTSPAEYNFPSIQVDGKQNLTLQISYSSLDASDCKLVFEQS